MRKWGRIAGLLLLLVASSPYGQELSQEVYSSEDELWEALRDGIITWEQYEVLRDLVGQGIDSIGVYLLDQIPNVIYLMKSDSALVSGACQSEAFVAKSSHRPSPRKVGGRFFHRHLMSLDRDESSGYRGGANLTIAERWRVGVRFSRERSGCERLAERSLGYRNRSGVVRRVEAGNFTTRLGSGLLFGHRGRVLKASHGYGAESWAYPDFGGFNGLFAELAGDWVRMRALASASRDSTHRILAGGLEVQASGRKFRPGTVIGLFELTNRRSNVSAAVPMASLTLEYDYSGGNLAAELGRQFRTRPANALVIEGRHRNESAQLTFAGWWYDEAFLDLTAGSKSGVLYTADTLESVDLSFRTRRSGQAGAIVRTEAPLGSRAGLAGSIMSAANGSRGSRNQVAAEVVIRPTGPNSLRLSYLGDARCDATCDPRERGNHQVRLEARYEGDRTRLRCYIGCRTDDRSECPMSLFLSGRRSLADGSVYEVWSNCSRVGPDGIERWYMYGRGVWRLAETLTCGAKVVHSYNRGSGQRHATQLSLEVTAEL